MASFLSDVLSAAQLGAATIYHEALAIVPDVHDWSMAHPELAPLLDKGVAFAQQALEATMSPGAVAAGHVLGYLRQLAATDATVASRPSSL